MSDKIEDKTVEIMDKSMEAVEQFASKLKDLAEQYGPEVADLALATARVDAASGLLKGFAMLGLFILVGFYSYKTAKHGYKLYKAHEGYGPKSGEGFIGIGTVGIVMSVGFSILSFLFYLSDIWSWVGVFYPEIWIAKSILGL